MKPVSDAKNRHESNGCRKKVMNAEASESDHQNMVSAAQATPTKTKRDRVMVMRTVPLDGPRLRRRKRCRTRPIQV